MLDTKQITEKYNVTRQTINNWINDGKLQRPDKDNRNKWIWDIKNENELKFIVEESNLVRDKQRELEIGNRRYLGSKQKLLGFIDEVVANHTTEITSIADIFGGIGNVAHLFQQKGIPVIVNDILYSNYISYLTWFGNEKVDYEKVESKLQELNELKGVSGYVTENFGNRYFSMDNAMKIDAIREEIENIEEFNKREKSFLMTSLIYAADKVANTVGHYDAYRRKMDSYTPIFLRIPVHYENSFNKVYNTDANELVRNIYADLIYIDTPYNSRGYENMYHVLENIAEWEKVPVTGVAKKAINRSEKSSEYNRKSAPQAFDDLIQHINGKYILVSYNNMAKKGNSRSNAKISNEEIIESLSKRGEVQIFETDFNPFTTGKSIIDEHKELLYLCTIDRSEYSE